MARGDLRRPGRGSFSRVAAVVVVAAPLVVGCNASAAAPAAVSVTAKEFQLALGSPTAAAGTVTFTIKNDGTVTHEFVVIKTDLASDKLPTAADGNVDEESSELTHVDEVEDITAGSTKPLKVDLPAGHYVLVCNLPGHYAGGMRAKLDVTGAG